MNRPKNLEELIDFKKIQKIYDLCFKIQTKGIATVFVYFMGHINSVEITVYYGGWTSGADGEKQSFYVSDREYSQEKMNHACEWLKDILNTSLSYEEISAKRLEREKELKRQQYEALKAEFENDL